MNIKAHLWTIATIAVIAGAFYLIATYPWLIILGLSTALAIAVYLGIYNMFSNPHH